MKPMECGLSWSHGGSGEAWSGYLGSIRAARGLRLVSMWGVLMELFPACVGEPSPLSERPRGVLRGRCKSCYFSVFEFSNRTGITENRASHNT